jgi:UDP-N-acetylglucosamine acyltransferase
MFTYKELINTMTMTIHRTAIISDGAQIDETAQVGPYAVIGPNVKIGARTKIGAHAVIDGVTTIGQDCHIFAGASIGLEPQDLKYAGEPTGVLIGDRVTVREYATIHRATHEGFTVIGDDCFLMNYVHIAHNCKLGRGVIMANSTMLAGYGVVGEYAVFAGAIIVHQNVRIGRLCMISGLSGVRVDLPPFATTSGRRPRVRGINIIGMRRARMAQDVRAAIKEAYRIIYRTEMNITQALETIEKEVHPHPEIVEILEFYRSSKRGVVGRNEPSSDGDGGEDA